jgi:DNA-binding XRE family transcriptional regulator
MDLATTRAMKKLTQWDLKVATGIHQSKISLFENGYLVPNEKEKLSIAKALNLKPDDISWVQESISEAV